MEVKKDVDAESMDFWYDIREGYLDPDKLCVYNADAILVKQAVNILREFEESCNEQIPGFTL